MSKQSLLLVDGDTRSLRVLEVSLRKAGFTVTPVGSVSDALDKLELHVPDLIISETKFPTDLDGFELRRRIRGVPDWAEIPFVFLTAETAIEHKIRGLELGVDDYLTKPIYIKEIVTRINILLQKRQRAYFDERKDGVRFAGRVADMPVVDVIQTIEVSRKSGVIQFVGDRHRTAAIYFRDGKVIDAEAGTLQGEDAVYRLLTWGEGEFEVVFRTVRRREAITTSSQGLLMEGMRRLDEWSRILEQLPPLTHRFEIDAVELSGRLGEVPDDNNPILRLIDGKRSLIEVIDASDFGDLECLQAIARLYFEGLLIDLEPDHRPKRDTGKPMPLVIVESAPTPIEEVASGPINIGNLVESGRTRTDSGSPVAVVDSGSGRTRTPSGGPATARKRTPTGTPVATIAVGSTRTKAESASPPVDPSKPRRAKRISVGIGTPEIPSGPAIRAPRMRTDSGMPAPTESGRAKSESDGPLPIGSPIPSITGESGRAKSESGSPVVTNEAATSEPAGAAIPPPLDSTAPVSEAAVISEEDDHGPGPLMGGYRHSSLRLIDEAVAAAQAIDPSLFESDLGALASPTDDTIEGAQPARTKPRSVPPPVPLAAIERAIARADASGEFPLPEDDYSGVPTVIEAESAPHSLPDEGPTSPSLRPFGVRQERREDSGLRMIGSHGRDRAEASGEVMPIRATTSAPAVDPQRELVTIMPRRITREMPVLSAPAAAVEAEETAAPEPRRPRSPSVDDVPRMRAGPGLGASILLGVASLMAAMSVYIYVHHRSAARAARKPIAAVQEAGPSVPDATEMVAGEADAAESADARDYAIVPRDAPEVAVAAIDAEVHPRPDAAVRVAMIDAGVRAVPDARVRVAMIDAGVRAVPDARVRVAMIDAGVRVATPADGGDGADHVRQARTLLEQAHSALEDGDPEKALQLADASLKLRKTARTYLERARALQRLNQIEEALASVDAAMAIVSDYAPAWEQRGMILWAARRHDEARPALEKYLALDPNGRNAASIRQMLGQP